LFKAFGYTFFDALACSFQTDGKNPEIISELFCSPGLYDRDFLTGIVLLLESRFVCPGSLQE
jgi:hypothetical protein